MGAASSTDPSRRIWKTIVRTSGGASYGLVVDDVLDIIEVKPDERPHASPDASIASVLVVGGRVTEVIDEAWLAASFGSPRAAIGLGATADAAEVDELFKTTTDDLGPQSVQLCTFRLGETLYGIDVLDVQEVLMPQYRTPIPLSPPEVEGLLNLRGDTVLSVDLGVLLGIRSGVQSEPVIATTQEAEEALEGEERMNVVLRSSQGSLSMLVDEVGEVMDLPKGSFEPCPATISEIQRQVARGIYKLEDDLLIQLDVDELHGLVTQSHSMARA